MENNNKLTNKATSCCKKLPYIVHELSQSLFVIQTYITALIARINADNLNETELSEILKKINQQVDTMGTIIHSMTSDTIQ